MAEVSIYTDSGKRGRLFVLASLLAISLFFVRNAFDIDLRSISHLAGLTASYFVAVYILLLWAFRFQFTRSSLLVVIPQSALFVSLQMVFLLLFFFADLQRVYQFVIVFILSSFVFVTTYISFLMSNIFNVSTFKPLPLIEVARTTSYILTLLTTYFVTFSIVYSLENFLTICIVLFGLYFIIVLLHLTHLGGAIPKTTQYASIIAFVMTLSAVSLFLCGVRIELLGIVPTAVSFGLIGIEMASIKNSVRTMLLLQYSAIFIASIIFCLSL